MKSSDQDVKEINKEPKNKESTMSQDESGSSTSRNSIEESK